MARRRTDAGALVRPRVQRAGGVTAADNEVVLEATNERNGCLIRVRTILHDRLHVEVSRADDVTLSGPGVSDPTAQRRALAKAERDGADEALSALAAELLEEQWPDGVVSLQDVLRRISDARHAADLTLRMRLC